MDLNEFRTSNTYALPLLHLILQLADLSESKMYTFIPFLHRVISNPNPFFVANPADGLDCALQSASGQKAGEMFPRQAAAILCAACKQSDLKVVRGMLVAGTDVNQCDDSALSPLMHACVTGNIEIMDALVHHGVSLNQTNANQQSSLLLACANKQWQAAIAMYQHIMNAESYKSPELDQAFLTAIDLHGVSYVQHVAKHDSRACEILMTKVSLFDACKHGYSLVVSHCMESQSHSKTDVIKAVHTACSYNHPCVIPALIPHLDTRTISSLITEAYQHEHYNFAHKLFQCCTDRSTLPCPNISVSDACKANHVDLLEFLIEHGKDVNKVEDCIGFALKYEPKDKDIVTSILTKHGFPTDTNKPENNESGDETPERIVQYKMEENKTDKSKTEENKTEERKTEENRTEESKTEENKTKESKTEPNKTYKTKTEENKTGESKTEDNKTEESKTEDNRTEGSKTEEHRTEENKTEENQTKENKTEKNRTEESKTEENKPEEHKTEENKTEQSKTEENKTEERKTDENKTDKSKTEENKNGESKTEDNKTEESKAEENKTEESKTEENRVEENKTEENKAEESKTEENKTDKSKTEETKITENKTEEKRTDEHKTEGNKAEESKTLENKTEECKTEENKTEESKTEENKTEENKTEENKTEESKTLENKTEESKTEKNKTEENKTEENKTEERKTEENKTDEGKTEGNKTEGSKTEENKTEGSKTDKNITEQSNSEESDSTLKEKSGDEHDIVHLRKSLHPSNDHNCHPPLVYASMQGNADAVKLLLQHKACPNILSDETPLTAACKHGHIEVVEILLSNPTKPDLNHTNMFGMTPLQVAIHHNHAQIAKHLVNLGADLNVCKLPAANEQLIQKDISFSPLDERNPPWPELAELSKIFKEVVKTKTVWQVVQDAVKSKIWQLRVEDKIMTPEESSKPPIVLAYNSKQYDLVRFFVDHNVQIQPLLEIATLHEICHTNSMPVIQDLLHSNTDQILNVHAALEVAVTVGNVKLLQLLLDQLHVDGKRDAMVSTMTKACEVGSNEIVCLLLKHNSDLLMAFQHTSGCSCQHPLCIAISNLDHAVIDTLHKHGAHLLVKQRSGKDCPSNEPICYDLCQGSLRELCSHKDEFRDIRPFLPECVSRSSLNFALIASCKAAHTHAARMLVRKSADVNYCDEDGMTPLHAAIKASSSELVTLLLSAGADPNHVNSEQKTPLFVACELEHCEIAAKLIYAGANTNPQSHSPLSVTCNRNYLDIVQLLLENKANPNHSSNDPNQTEKEVHHLVQQAHKSKQYEVVRLLLEYGTDPNDLIKVDLKSACEMGYAEAALHIIHGYSQDVSSIFLDQCIESAYRNGFLETAIGVMIDIQDPDLKCHCTCLLHNLLTSKGVLQECNSNLEKEVVSDESSQTPLWQFCERRSIAKVRELISNGADVNIPNAAGRSMLQECIHRKITLLIPDLCNSPKIDINYCDTAGRTALFYSLSCPHIPRGHTNKSTKANADTGLISVFEYLVSKGADVSVRDHFGRYVLHEWQPTSDGTERGPSLKAIRECINVDINCRDHKLHTALHLAVLRGSVLAVRQLVENGADQDALDINGLTPLFLATQNAHVLKVLSKEQTDCQDGMSVSVLSDEPESSAAMNVHMLKDKIKQHRLVPALKEAFRDRAKHTVLEKFQKSYAERVYYTMQPKMQAEMNKFSDTLIHMLTEINKLITQEEPVLSFTPRLSGSCAEGTKVIAIDEADMLCVFDNDLWENVTLSTVTNDDKIHNNQSFVQISSTALASKHPELFDCMAISKKKLLQRLYSLIRKALPVVLQNIKNLYVIDVTNAFSNDHSLACLSMVWHGEELQWQKFTVDLVPAIPIKLKQLPDVTQTSMCHSDILKDLFVVPKTGTFDQSQNDAAFRVSFSTTERNLFHAMPTSLKQGYMLTKVLFNDCFTIDSLQSGLCSYNLKTAAFECLKAEVPDLQKLLMPHQEDKIAEMSSPDAPSSETMENMLRWARAILSTLERSCAQSHQYSFFVKECDLMTHSIDKNDYRPMLCIKYCRARLHSIYDDTWKKLADYVAQQLLKPENLHEKCFVHEIEALLEMGVTPSIPIRNTMIKLGQVAGVKMLLEKGVSVEDEDGSTILQLAQHVPHGGDVLPFLQENIQGNNIEYLC